MKEITQDSETEFDAILQALHIRQHQVNYTVYRLDEVIECTFKIGRVKSWLSSLMLQE